MYERKQVINDKSVRLLDNGTVKKGDKFQITHCDGYVANEIIEYIVRHTWEEPYNNLSSHYCQKKMDVIVCESGCCYDIEELN